MIRLFIVEITGEKKDKKLLDKTRAKSESSKHMQRNIIFSIRSFS